MPSDLDAFFRARDKKYGVAPESKYWDYDSRGNKIIKFNAEKLRSFAAGVGVDQADIVEPLSVAIVSGGAPQYILDLLADKYDDVFLYKVGDYAEQPVVYYGNPEDIKRHHKLDFQLAAAKLSRNPGTVDRYRRNYRCTGFEYLNWDDTHELPPLCNHVREELAEMPTTTAPRIWWDEATGEYACKTPYSEDFIMFVKLIEREDKRWDEALKIRYFSPRVIDRVKDKMERLWGSVSFIGPNTAPRPVLSLSNDTFGKFARLAGRDAMRKAYHAAALRLHTDTGGDKDAITELNVLWKEIEEVLK